MSEVVGRGPDGSDGPHVFVEDVAVPALDAADDAHLRRSLRLRNGDPFTVSDGMGSWRCCRLGSVVEPTDEIVVVPRRHPILTVAFALTKGAKPEFVVQKLTEVGIDTITPFVAARSIPRWDHAREAKNLARLGRVAREAAMQCRRVWLPEVTGIGSFESVAELPDAVRADMGGAPIADETTILIGPEGGWDDAERDRVRAVGLGPHVLRAETAAVAAGVLLAHRHRALT